MIGYIYLLHGSLSLLYDGERGSHTAPPLPLSCFISGHFYLQPSLSYVGCYFFSVTSEYGVRLTLSKDSFLELLFRPHKK